MMQKKTSEAQLSHLAGNVNTKNIKLNKSIENLITKSQHKIISLQRNKEKLILKKNLELLFTSYILHIHLLDAISFLSIYNFSNR